MEEKEGGNAMCGNVGNGKRNLVLKCWWWSKMLKAVGMDCEM